MNVTKGPLDVVFEPDRPAHETDAEDAIEITPEMIEIGADVILGVVGGADLGGFFSAPELAEKVFRAMAIHRHSAKRQRVR